MIRFRLCAATAVATAAAASNISVPGSGTGAIADAAEGTACEGIAAAGSIDKSVGSPTERSVPSAIAWLFVTMSVPPSTVVPPEYEFVPVSVKTPAPVFARARTPRPFWIVPEKVLV